MNGKEKFLMSMFQILAIFLLLVFYGSYFAKKLGQKKKGIQTTQIGKGKTGFARMVEMTMGIATLCIVIVELISIVYDWSMSPVWLRIVGIVLSVIGNVSFITAMLTMRDSWRAGVTADKTELITNGIFQVSRNPAFLGFDLVYVGILFLFFNWVLCVFTVFAILMLHLQIVNNEEDAMLAAFGDEYLNYKSKVKRYLGRR